MLQLEKHAGKGADLVLLPGWGSDAAIFNPLVSRLIPHFNLYLGSWIDTQAVTGTSEVLREQLLETLLKQAPEKAIWVGWSLGGQLALSLAVRSPERVERIMTLAFNPCFVQRNNWQCAMPEQEFNHFCQAFKENPSHTLKRFQSLQTLNSPDQRNLLQQLVRSQTHLSPHSLSRLLNLLADDVREWIQQVHVPQMHCYGDLDALVPGQALPMALKKLNPLIETRCYEKASHLPFLSAVDEWLHDLRQWSCE